MKNIDAIAREERLAYMREWRAKNKDKVRANNKRYWEKKALKRIERENANKQPNARKQNNPSKSEWNFDLFGEGLDDALDIDIGPFDFDLNLDDEKPTEGS